MSLGRRELPIVLHGRAEGVGVAVVDAVHAQVAGIGRVDVEAYEMQRVDVVAAPGKVDLQLTAVGQVHPRMVGPALAAGQHGRGSSALFTDAARLMAPKPSRTATLNFRRCRSR